MTPTHILARNAHRRATALLLAAVALPATAYAQDTVTPPVVVVPAPAPAPVPAPEAQTPSTTPAPTTGSRTTIAPGVVEAAQQEARERATTQRAERPAPAQRAPAARSVTRAPVAATPVAAAPAAAAPEPANPAPTTPVASTPTATAPAPVAATPAETAQTQPAETTANGGTLWLILAGLGVVAAAIAAMLLLRRRRDEEVYDDSYVAEPVAAEPVHEPVVEPLPAEQPRAIDVAPIAAAPAFIDRPAAFQPRHEPEVHAALENPTLHRPDSADIDAVLGGAAPEGDRPQLELAMRPLRAGVTRNEGVVEFELTVANAGGVQAEDVRIGAFMLNGGEASAIERLLVDPPADAVVTADAIAPGEGTRVDAAVTLPRDDFDGDRIGHDGFTPIVLADARYRLPDGSEGRTAAAFTISRVNGDEALLPIDLDNGPAMYDDIEARLHSVAAKV